MGAVSAQTTLMLPPRSTAIRGLLGLAIKLPWGFERFVGVRKKCAPPSVERLKEMFERPAISSSQTTLMLPFLSRAICGSIEPLGLVEIMFGAENVTPPSIELLKRIPRLILPRPRGSSVSQTTLMLPALSTAICGTE